MTYLETNGASLRHLITAPVRVERPSTTAAGWGSRSCGSTMVLGWNEEPPSTRREASVTFSVPWPGMEVGWLAEGTAVCFPTPWVPV